jgi:hypothetical protein
LHHTPFTITPFQASSITMACSPIDEKHLAQQVESLESSKHPSPNRAGDLNLIDDNGATRRIPIPTNDPNDPLNFSKWRKLGILVSCCWFSIFSLVLVGGVGPIIPVFMGMYIPQGKTPEEVVSLSTYPSVTMAAGKICFPWGKWV